MKIGPGNILKGIYSEKSLERIINNSKIKARVVGANMNNVKIELENGRQLTAKSNIPLENFLGEKLTFKIIKNEDSMVIRPQIEGKAQQRELNMKVSKLLSSMDIQDTAANREVAKAMIKNGIPVNKSNFTSIKEDINSLEKLKFIIQNEPMNIEGEVERPLQKDIKDIVRDIIIDKRGENINRIFENMEISDMEKKEIILLHKLGQKINLANLNAINSIFYKNENVLGIIDSIGNIFEQLLNTKKNDDKSENLDSSKFASEDAKTKGDFGSKDGKIGKEKILQTINLLTKKEMQKGRDIKNAKQNLKSLADGVDEIMEFVHANEDDKLEMEVANQKLKLLYELDRFFGYIQLPVGERNYKRFIELISKKKVKKSKSDSGGYAVSFSTDTENDGRINCSIEHSSSKGFEISFAFTDQKALKKFKVNTKRLIETLNPLGIKVSSVKFEISDCPGNIHGLIPKEDDISNFDVWV